MKRILSILTTLSMVLPILAHSGYQKHCEEMLAVLGIDQYQNPRIYNTSKASWARFISSDMIDNTEFHRKLEQNHINFRISSPKRHRFLFHWGYESEPWTIGLERLVIEYCERYKLDIPSTIKSFKAEIKSEQARRNRTIIKRTEEVFQLSHGGIDGVYAHFLASIAYNVHILGDYETDNKVLDGLADLNYLIGQFVIEIRRLDQSQGKSIIQKITTINKQIINEQEKADKLMECLINNMPDFVKKARNGSFKKRLEDHNIILTK